MPLPSPPKSVGSRPLPPNPSGGSDDGPPPPLPSRPGGASRNPPPPPVNGHGQSSGSSDSENEEYVEPEESSPPPPVSRGAPPGRGAKPPAPIPEPEQETYDELDDLVPPPPVEEIQQETYDECEFKAPTQGQPAQLVQEELYEFDPEDNSDEEIQESLYEAVTEDDRRGGGSPSQPVPPSIPPPHRPAIPAPPSPPVSAPPSLPSRPPARVPEPAHESEPGPARAVLKKNISGEGAKLLGAISPAEIGAKIGALRKVSTSSEPPKEEPKPQESDSAGSGNSFADRMAKFKSAEKGVKPILPVKPSFTSDKLRSPTSPRSPPAMETTPAPPPVAKATPQTQAPQNEQDDIYDDGLSFMADPLQNEEWYHGMVSRNESKAKLDTIQQDGAFLVRKSEKGGDHQPYTLVVLFKGHVYNLKVRVRSDNQVALGEAKPDEMAFKDVPALISHHKHNDVILVNVAEKKQYKTLLKRFPLNIMK